jgi:hypothetical protein
MQVHMGGTGKVWGQAPDAVKQLLAGAILRDGTGAAVVAASPIIVQAPNAGGVMAPHVSVYTVADNTTLLPRDLVQRFGTAYLPQVGLPGFVATAGGVQVTAAFAFNGAYVHRGAVSPVRRPDGDSQRAGSAYRRCVAPALADGRPRRCPMSREPALEVGECPLTRHRPQVRRVTHTRVGRSVERLYTTAVWHPFVVRASRTRAMLLLTCLVP